MKQQNLLAKYGISAEELKRAVDQIKLGNIACSGAVHCASCWQTVTYRWTGCSNEKKRVAPL